MKRLIAIILGLVLAAPAFGQPASGPYQFRSAGYCQMTSALSSAVSVATANCSSGAVPGGQILLMNICVTVAAVRYRDDGTNPTASIGMPVGAGTCLNYAGDPRGLILIQQASGAVVDILFYN